ncbi:MAG: alkaline phosphatase family protein [Caldilineaceae bacterium]
MDHNNSTNGNGLHANGHHRNGSGGAAAPKARVLVIGLDGATFDLIKPWAAEGRLPTLARLMDGGAHGSLHSTIPPMTGPAWTTFATGVNPGKHDLYDWIAREAGTYHFLPTTALDCKTPTVYELLSQVGRSVCVMNVPMTFRPSPSTAWSSPACPLIWRARHLPETLLDEIRENVGDYILYPDPGQAYSDSGIDAFLTALSHHRSARGDAGLPARSQRLGLRHGRLQRHRHHLPPCGSSWTAATRSTIRPRRRSTATPSATTTAMWTPSWPPSSTSWTTTPR